MANIMALRPPRTKKVKRSRRSNRKYVIRLVAGCDDVDALLPRPSPVPLVASLATEVVAKEVDHELLVPVDSGTSSGVGLGLLFSMLESE